MSEGPLQTVQATVLFADVVESMRLIAQDEPLHAARVQRLVRGLGQRYVQQFGGRVLERRGDGLLASFESPRQAAAAALASLAALPASGDAAAGLAPLQLRIGLHCASLLLDEDGGAYGQGLGLAARLAALAQPDEVWLSAEVRDQLTEPLDGQLVDQGEVFVKHVPQPLRAYRLRAGPAAEVLTAGAGARAPDGGHQAPPDIRPRLAVLPLAWDAACAVAPTAATGPGAAPGAGPDAGDVLVDRLAAALSASPLLQITSMLSSNAFRGRGIAPAEAGQRLGADYVLAGLRLPTEAHRLAVQLRLLHVRTGRCVWEAERACAAAAVADAGPPWLGEVVLAVADALSVTELDIARGQPLPNLATHTLYLAAVGMLHRFSRSDFERAHDMLQALRERAPRHAVPAAWLARWHVFRIVQGWSPDVARDSALASDQAQRALDRDPDSSLALTMAGSVRAGAHLDMAGARSYYELALTRNPSEPLAWLLKGVAHGFLGEGEAALASSERSLQLSPLDPLRFYYDSLSATAAMGARQYARAVELAERAIRANCMHGSSYRALAIAQMMLGRTDDARATVLRLRAVEPGSSVRQFLSRAAVDSEQNRLFARALADAGLPAG
ncbi:tetratricopeptide repeat protein [Ideonella sp. DXS22W]|uniref:Tetratricopeptide repeat protein n=1 Tax=Pseudaquabacterium inlustre TaxID=2984192 RepID=A0ABU9CMJ3_9BURK